jgi:serine/threonine protein kinase
MLPTFYTKVERRLHSITALLVYQHDAVLKDEVNGVTASLVPWTVAARKSLTPIDLTLTTARTGSAGQWLLEFEDVQGTMLRPDMRYSIVVKSASDVAYFGWMYEEDSRVYVPMSNNTIIDDGIYTSSFQEYDADTPNMAAMYSVRTFGTWAPSYCEAPCAHAPNWSSRSYGLAHTVNTDSRTFFGFPDTTALVAQEWTATEDIDIASFLVQVDSAPTAHPLHTSFLHAQVVSLNPSAPDDFTVLTVVASFAHQVDVPTAFAGAWRFDFVPKSGKSAWSAQKGARYGIRFTLGDTGPAPFYEDWTDTFSMITHEEDSSASLGPAWTYNKVDKWKKAGRGLALQLIPTCRNEKAPEPVKDVPVCLAEAGPTTMTEYGMNAGILAVSGQNDIFVPISVETSARLYAARILVKPTSGQAITAALYKGSRQDGTEELLVSLSPDTRANNATTLVTLVPEGPTKPMLYAGMPYVLRVWTTNNQTAALRWALVTGDLPDWSSKTFGDAAAWSSPTSRVPLYENQGRLALALDFVPSGQDSSAVYGPCLFGCLPERLVNHPIQGTVYTQTAKQMWGAQLIVTDRLYHLAKLTIRVAVSSTKPGDLANNALQHVSISKAIVGDDGLTYVPGLALTTLTEEPAGRTISNGNVDLVYRVSGDESTWFLPNVPYMISFLPNGDFVPFDWILGSSPAPFLGYSVRVAMGSDWTKTDKLTVSYSRQFAVNLYEACNLPWSSVTSPLEYDPTVDNPTTTTTVGDQTKTTTTTPTTRAATTKATTTTSDRTPSATTGPATTTVKVTGSSVTLTLTGDCEKFDADDFEHNVAKILNVGDDRVHVQDARCGSIIVDLFLANLPVAEEDEKAASELMTSLLAHIESGLFQEVTKYPATVGEVKEEDTAEVTIPAALAENQEEGGGTGGGGLGAGTIAALVVAALILILGIALTVRHFARREQERATAGGGGAAPDTYTGASAARSGGTGTLSTPMNTMSTTGSGTGPIGKPINVDASSAPLDAKYIIDSADLEKGAKIGEGGYGYVYRGEWRGTTVAIKEVRGEERSVVDMLMLEARAAVDLRPHANIVTLYGVCLQPFSIVTAFCERGSLDDMLYGKKPVVFSPAEEKQLCIGIASGVSHLHLEGMIHRDLAARNILVNATGVPMVADFGMARRDEGDERTANQTKSTVGPIRWMAPEQMEHQEYSIYSDVWSYGVILYEIFARQLPWKGVSNIKAAQYVMSGKHLAQDKFAPPDANPCVRKVMTACFAFEAMNRPKAAWCTQKLSKDYELADGGKAFSPAAGSRSSRRKRPEPSDDVYAAPPSRNTQRKRGSRRSSMRGSDDGTYTAPTRASQVDPYSAPPI